MAAVLSGAVAGAQCPAPQGVQLYAYQSAATAVELVVVGGALAGADHWEVMRTRTGQAPVALLPARIPAATTSIIDQQGLQSGGTYTLTVEDAAGGRVSSTAAVIDVGNTPPHALGSTLTLSSSFGFDPSTNQRIAWGQFPSRIGRTYAGLERAGHRGGRAGRDRRALRRRLRRAPGRRSRLDRVRPHPHTLEVACTYFDVAGSCCSSRRPAVCRRTRARW